MTLQALSVLPRVRGSVGLCCRYAVHSDYREALLPFLVPFNGAVCGRLKSIPDPTIKFAEDTRR